MSTPEPLGTPGSVLTAVLLRDRLSKVSEMCMDGQLLRPIITELRYLADELERVDRSFAASMCRLDPDWRVS